MPDFSVLIVCTGNICRSPAAERLLVDALPAGTGIDVASAGTRALVGAPIDGPMAKRLAQHNVGADGFSARQLTPADVQGADLILTMMKRHQSAVALLHPSAVRRTFVLREFAAILDTDGIAWGPLASSPLDRLRDAIPRVMISRSARGAVTGRVDFDIEDPYQQRESVFDSSFSQIHGSMTSIARFLLPLP